MLTKNDPTKNRNTDERQVRSFGMSQFRALDATGKKQIECYFAVFSDKYELWEGYTESIDPNAFDGTINDDIRCLVNHEPARVLGRTKAGTLQLSIDSYGLKGIVDINEDDSDAMNLYSRVQRGDVSQCSIGFEILEEVFTQSTPNTGHWLIKRVKLYEGSVVTFPAYEKTEAHAREARQAEVNRRFKESMKERTSKWHSSN